MKTGFTGTQKGMSSRQIHTFRKLLAGSSELHHGDCFGADAHAHIEARAMNIPIEIHPMEPDNKRAYCEGARVVYPSKPPLVRNVDIVKATDRLIATPKEFTNQLRSGTWYTIRKGAEESWLRPYEVIIILPDGTLTTPSRIGIIGRR